MTQPTSAAQKVGHTPGPWILDGVENGGGGITCAWIAKADKHGAADGRVAGAFGNCLVKTDAKVIANAKLIAAAPMMLATLRDLKERLRQCADAPVTAHEAFDSFYELLIDEAIARATRESEDV